MATEELNKDLAEAQYKAMRAEADLINSNIMHAEMCKTKDAEFDELLSQYNELERKFELYRLKSELWVRKHCEKCCGRNDCVIEEWTTKVGEDE